MGICAFYGCSNHTRNCKKSGIHFFTFPKNKKLTKQWLHLCKRKDKVNLKHALVCSIHFCEDDYENLLENKMMKTKLRLKIGVVPSKNLPILNTLQEEKQGNNSVKNLRPSRKKRQKLDVLTNAMNGTLSNTQLEDDQHCDQASTTPQMAVTLFTNEQLGIENQLLKTGNQLLKTEYQLLKTENQLLKTENQQQKTENQLLKIENQQQKSENELLKSANNQLTIENEELRNGMKLFEELFTPGQLKRISNLNKKNSHWEKEDIAAAITLKRLSSKCYRYLREVKKFPLPAETTLHYRLKDL